MTEIFIFNCDNKYHMHKDLRTKFCKTLSYIHLEEYRNFHFRKLYPKQTSNRIDYRFLKMYPIILASKSGDYDSVAYLVSNGANVNAIDAEGNTSLHFANTFPIVNILVEAGADVNAKNKDGDTPLHMSAKIGDAEICRLLIDNGAKVNATNIKKQYPIHFAAYFCNVDVFNLLVANGSPIDASDDDLFTPLHLATAKGCVELVRLLVANKSVDIKSYERKDHNNALHMAVLFGHYNIVDILAMPKMIESTNEKWYTPLIMAARMNRQDILELLVNRSAKIDATSKSGNCALYAAVNNGNIDMTRYLLDHGAKTKRSLFIAVDTGNVDMCRLLIERGADVNIRDAKSENVLIIASRKGNREIVELLLQSGANSKLKEAMEEAKRAGHDEIVAILSGVEKPRGIRNFFREIGNAMSSIV